MSFSIDFDTPAEVHTRTRERGSAFSAPDLAVVHERPLLEMVMDVTTLHVPPSATHLPEKKPRRKNAREARMSFAATPSASEDRPRFHSYVVPKLQQQVLPEYIKKKTSTVNTNESAERKASRKPTSYYEVYPLSAYDSKTEKSKKLQIPAHDPRYQLSLREEFLNRKYTLIACGIGAAVFALMGGLIIWLFFVDFQKPKP